MTDHYRHAEPHVARDLADGAALGLKVMATLTLGTAVIIVLFLANAGLEFYVAGFLGLGAILVSLFERQQRATTTNVQPVETTGIELMSLDHEYVPWCTCHNCRGDYR
jgi:hypothetical protein